MYNRNILILGEVYMMCDWKCVRLIVFLNSIKGEDK